MLSFWGGCACGAAAVVNFGTIGISNKLVLLSRDFAGPVSFLSVIDSFFGRSFLRESATLPALPSAPKPPPFPECCDFGSDPTRGARRAVSGHWAGEARGGPVGARCERTDFARSV